MSYKTGGRRSVPCEIKGQQILASTWLGGSGDTRVLVMCSDCSETRWVSLRTLKRTSGRCRSCRAKRPSNPQRRKNYAREYGRKRRARLYEIIDRHKLEAGCAHCGYHEDARALDFDHIDPATKVQTISWLVTTSGVNPDNPKHMAKLMDEIAKCQVLCANCHRIKTREAREGHWNSPE